MDNNQPSHAQMSPWTGRLPGPRCADQEAAVAAEEDFDDEPDDDEPFDDALPELLDEEPPDELSLEDEPDSELSDESLAPFPVALLSVR